ncbi:hypothetical protein [Paraburkholderia sp. RL18-085-BIA-A]|jgi:hypothetical protein|uniref:hypothetical protein n=2 Tax=unclassified Paraburkholderia TaxID=2615204 RepID=UPI0038B9E864
MISSLQIADPYMFVLKETLNFAQSEVADRLREASSECGVESVFRVLPKFSEVGFQEVAGAYMRGAFAGKWGDLRDECRSAVLQSQIRQLLQWTPSARRAV